VRIGARILVLASLLFAVSEAPAGALGFEPVAADVEFFAFALPFELRLTARWFDATDLPSEPPATGSAVFPNLPPIEPTPVGLVYAVFQVENRGVNPVTDLRVRTSKPAVRFGAFDGEPGLPEWVDFQAFLDGAAALPYILQFAGAGLGSGETSREVFFVAERGNEFGPADWFVFHHLFGGQLATFTVVPEAPRATLIVVASAVVAVRVVISSLPLRDTFGWALRGFFVVGPRCRSSARPRAG
jgi:hypothetical protein